MYTYACVSLYAINETTELLTFKVTVLRKLVVLYIHCLHKTFSMSTCSYTDLTVANNHFCRFKWRFTSFLFTLILNSG